MISLELKDFFIILDGMIKMKFLPLTFYTVIERTIEYTGEIFYQVRYHELFGLVWFTYSAEHKTKESALKDIESSLEFKRRQKSKTKTVYKACP